jgi:hypothetical protein
LFTSGIYGSGEDFKDLTSYFGFSLSVQKILGISESYEQILKRPT